MESDKEQIIQWIENHIEEEKDRIKLKKRLKNDSYFKKLNQKKIRKKMKRISEALQNKCVEFWEQLKSKTRKKKQESQAKTSDSKLPSSQDSKARPNKLGSR